MWKSTRNSIPKDLKEALEYNDEDYINRTISLNILEKILLDEEEELAISLLQVLIKPKINELLQTIIKNDNPKLFWFVTEHLNLVKSLYLESIAINGALNILKLFENSKASDELLKQALIHEHFKVAEYLIDNKISDPSNFKIYLLQSVGDNDSVAVKFLAGHIKLSENDLKMCKTLCSQKKYYNTYNVLIKAQSVL